MYICVHCKKTFWHWEGWNSHRIRIKNPPTDGPKFRCMSEKEFAEGLYSRTRNGWYYGGKREEWGALNDAVRPFDATKL